MNLETTGKNEERSRFDGVRDIFFDSKDVLHALDQKSENRSYAQRLDAFEEEYCTAVQRDTQDVADSFSASDKSVFGLQKESSLDNRTGALSRGTRLIQPGTFQNNFSMDAPTFASLKFIYPQNQGRSTYSRIEESKYILTV